MKEMRSVYTRLGSVKAPAKRRSPIRAAAHLAAGVAYLCAAALWRGPGVGFHLAVARRAIGLLRSDLPKGYVFSLASAPLDSFRYFEFDFFWESVTSRPNLGAWLDVSSPRLFNLRLLDSGKAGRAVMINPDRKDLATTKQLFDAAGVADRCELRSDLVSELKEAPASFDTVTCISVLEHIPSTEALSALTMMWSLLKPGGRLLLSVPCAREGFEEFIDFNEYGLLQADADQFVFGQRFYDESALAEQILSITGAPIRQAVFGERQPGAFLRNRQQKLREPNYAWWREPYFMATEFKHFARVDALPGLGVIAFEFVKL